MDNQPYFGKVKNNSPAKIMLVVLLALVAAAGIAFSIYQTVQLNDRNKKYSELESKTAEIEEQLAEALTPVEATCMQISSDRVFKIKEWEAEFIIPYSLVDVRYVIDESVAYIIARRKNTSVYYAGETTKDFIKNNALATLVRSTDKTKARLGNSSVAGKKVGEYYYYTNWSFSSLASGAGINEVFGSGPVEINTSSEVFSLLNDELLPSISVSCPETEEENK